MELDGDETDLELEEEEMNEEDGMEKDEDWEVGCIIFIIIITVNDFHDHYDLHKNLYWLSLLSIGVQHCAQWTLSVYVKPCPSLTHPALIQIRRDESLQHPPGR